MFGRRAIVLLAVLLAGLLSWPALAQEDPFGKYDPPIEAHFVRSTDDTLDANYFSQHPDKTMTDNLWIELYHDELGIDIVYDWIARYGEEYDQKLGLALASGDIPEFVNVSLVQLRQLADAGLIMPLEDIYDAYAAPRTRQIMAAAGNAPFEAATIDGHLYGLPNVDGTLNQPDLLWIRTDWLEALGLKPPETMEDLVAIIEAFAAADFDGNGVDDTVGLVFTKELWGTWAGLRGFFNGFDAYPGIWVEADGELVYGSILPGNRDALILLHEMYEKGLIDPDFGVKDANMVARTAANGLCGVAYGQQWNSIWPLQLSYDADRAHVQWQAFPIVSATGGPVKAQTADATTGWTVVRRDSQHPEAAVKLFNLFIEKCWGETAENDVYYAPLDSESIWKLSPVTPTNPTKNLDAFNALERYRETGDESQVTGEARSILVKLQQFESGSEEGFALWGWERIYGAGGAYGVLRDYQEGGLLQNDCFSGPPTATMAERMAVIQYIENDVFTRIILGEEDITAFDRFVDDFQRLGGDEITREVNAWYRAH